MLFLKMTLEFRKMTLEITKSHGILTKMTLEFLK